MNDRLTSSERSEGLDLLRSVAIGLVVFHHLPRLNVFPWIQDMGSTGVDLFFVLSGYLICNQIFEELNTKKRIGVMRFYLRRAFRILPAYFFVLFLFLSLTRLNVLTAGGPPLWKFLTFTMNFGFLPNLGGLNVPELSQAWSLCVEEHFYLLLPVLVLFFSKHKSKSLVVLFCIGLFLTGLILRANIWSTSLRLFAEDRGRSIGSFAYLKDIYFPTYCHLDGLLLGAGIALLKTFRPGKWKQILLSKKLVFGLGLTALIASVGYAAFLPRYCLTRILLDFPLISFAYACFVIFALAGRPRKHRRFYLSKIFANLAYSIYLIHPAIIHLAQFHSYRWGIGYSNFTWYIITLSLIVLSAILIYYFIERPFLKLRKMLLGPINLG